MPVVGYARRIGATVDQTVSALNELLEFDTCEAFWDQQREHRVMSPLNITDSNKKVTLICRRMDREEKTRESTAYRVARHRERNSNAAVTQKNGVSNANVTVPSSSSSASSSNYTVTTLQQSVTKPVTYSEGFQAFWAAYPKKKDPDTTWRVSRETLLPWA